MKKIIYPTLIAGFIFSNCTTAEVLTVQQVKELTQKGESGAQAAAVYASGVTDGLLAMASLERAESGELNEFCGYFDAAENGRPLPSPALHVKELVSAWERQGRDMNTVFPDLLINFMSAQYGCK